MLESVKKAFHRVFKELIEDIVMAVQDDFSSALAALTAQVAQLQTDVNTKLAADAAALAAAQAAALTEADVQAVQAVGTQVAAIDAVVNPVVSTTEAPSS